LYWLVLAAICVFLYLSRDPHKFIKDGDAAWLAKDYDRAERCYGRARGLARTDSLKKEVLFKAADMYVEADRWRHALGCWQEIIRIDPQNAKARYAQLTYVYVMADSGVRQVWQEVSSQASEFIELAADSGLLMQGDRPVGPFRTGGRGHGGAAIGPVLVFGTGPSDVRNCQQGRRDRPRRIAFAGHPRFREGVRA